MKTVTERPAPGARALRRLDRATADATGADRVRPVHRGPYDPGDGGMVFADRCPAWDVRAWSATYSVWQRWRLIREGGRQRGWPQKGDGAVHRRADRHSRYASDQDLTGTSIAARFATSRSQGGTREADGRPWFIRPGRARPPGCRRRPRSRGRSGFVNDVILTRDIWMHRIDVSRATGRPG